MSLTQRIAMCISVSMYVMLIVFMNGWYGLCVGMFDRVKCACLTVWNGRYCYGFANKVKIAVCICVEHISGGSVRESSKFKNEIYFGIIRN